MKPKRLGYTNDLVLNYNLYEKMLVLVKLQKQSTEWLLNDFK